MYETTGHLFEAMYAAQGQLARLRKIELEEEEASLETECRRVQALIGAIQAALALAKEMEG